MVATELNSIGPPPYDSFSNGSTYAKWATRYEPGNPSGWGLISLILFDSGASIRDLRVCVGCLTSSSNQFQASVDADHLTEFGTDFEIPFFVIQGALDSVTPVEPVKVYVGRIRAPQKRLVLIANGGHNAISSKSDEFLRILNQVVRPLPLQTEAARGSSRQQHT